jgi:hypothetical protein
MVRDAHAAGDVAQGVDLGKTGRQRLLRQHERVRAFDHRAHDRHVRRGRGRHDHDVGHETGCQRVVEAAEDGDAPRTVRERVGTADHRHVASLAQDVEVRLCDRAESDHEHSVPVGHGSSLVATAGVSLPSVRVSGRVSLRTTEALMGR